LKYRAEIDGLRALAVLPVILFHAGLEVFSGGFVGVDIFFVISGYLITTILLEDIESQRLSILNFYERRIRRIFPALFLVMLVCIPFAWAIMNAAQMRNFAASLFSTSVFLSNFYFLSQAGYFSPESEYQPLLHTWSLSIEEQYYLFFPLLLATLVKRSHRLALMVITLLCVASFLVAEWGWREHASRAFFSVSHGFGNY
jgi:peptidoglycan/LPS O-acetylase OafA/YrhL